jgi:integrase/recombinase XerD
MPATLSCTISKIATIPNKVNADMIAEYRKYMCDNGASERHQNNALKAVIAYAKFLGENTTFYDINTKEQIIAYLDTKINSAEQDPDKKWITTWNDNLHRIKHLFRWLYNQTGKHETIPVSNWETPAFAKIKEKKSKRLSPYSETEIWDRDELLLIVKYESYIRNKAALTLFWDLDARNHEVTMLKIKHIRMRERYGEGEVPHEAKTGGGPILLTCSFPYVRDWLNNHPFRNSPGARLICNLHNGSPIKPEAMNTMMKQLRKRIERLLERGEIKDPKEQEMLGYLLKTKKWNPYCIRHSAITYDSDSLPEFALKKKVRWSMNSKQPARYIKRRMGNNLKVQILQREGIDLDDGIAKPKPAVIICYRCNVVNPRENMFCSKCTYPLVPEAYDMLKESERNEIEQMKQKHELELKAVRDEMNSKINWLASLIQQNPKLAQVKPEALLQKHLEVTNTT